MMTTTHNPNVLARTVIALGQQVDAQRQRAEQAEQERDDRFWRDSLDAHPGPDRHHFEKRITTRCPTCGHQTLFIAVGGHLTCSWLKCPEPGVGRAIAEGRRHGALVVDELGGGADD